MAYGNPGGVPMEWQRSRWRGQGCVKWGHADCANRAHLYLHVVPIWSNTMTVAVLNLWQHHRMIIWPYALPLILLMCMSPTVWKDSANIHIVGANVWGVHGASPVFLFRMQVLWGWGPVGRAAQRVLWKIVTLRTHQVVSFTKGIVMLDQLERVTTLPVLQVALWFPLGIVMLEGV